MSEDTEFEIDEIVCNDDGEFPVFIGRKPGTNEFKTFAYTKIEDD